jgi:hypothetical protein
VVPEEKKAREAPCPVAATTLEKMVYVDGGYHTLGH